MTNRPRPHQRQRKRRRLNQPVQGTKSETWPQKNFEPPPIEPEFNSPPSQSELNRAHNRGISIAAESSPHEVGEKAPKTPKASFQPDGEDETPDSQGYLGRLEYLGVAASQANNLEGNDSEVQQLDKAKRLSPEEHAILNIHKAFDLPSLAVQRTLIDSFMAHCAPCMPIVESSWLRERGTLAEPPSLLLLQSVFVAGSRLAAASNISASSEIYYRRAKALFFSSYESNPVIKIASACLLNLWNPSAPEEVSLDSSNFWLRVAVSIAYQIGLHREPLKGKFSSYRRRLWWTLVV